jgi:hypothetical protein
LALLAHAGLFTLLAVGGGWLPGAVLSPGRPVQLTLAPPSFLQPQRGLAPKPVAAPGTPPASAAFAAPQAIAAPSQAAPVADIQGGLSARQASGSDTPAAALLPKSLGCDQPDAAWMSAAARAACRQQLAAGAAAAPHVEGMAPAKHAYYAAVAKAQDDWLSGRDAGHPPFAGCAVFWGPGETPKMPPHALKLGPCILEPPRGSLDPDVDVQPIGIARDPADVVGRRTVGPPAFHNPLYSGWRPAADH